MKKVLLIGLGGTGCAVVSRVKQLVEKVKEEDPTTAIRFLGFDTDTNQNDAPGLEVVNTSRGVKVNDLLRTEAHWQSWFPNNQMLRDRNMIKGAGQVRVLSRLAFTDCVRRGDDIRLLDEALRDLKEEKGESDEGLKIMIVSSFAGGTGSGMFLQLPMYLRKHIKETYPDLQILIRGLFALPDVFMGGSFNGIQKESMFANAYASLKELTAVNRICLSSNPDIRQYNMKIDDLFDTDQILSDDMDDFDLGEPGEDPRASNKPYDFIFFIDDLNANGNTINASKDVYFDEMAKITYMQVYGPMYNTTDSREDNLIISNIDKDGETMYGSAGSAKLVYPFEDIVSFCAHRKVSDVVNSKWSIIDREFEKLRSKMIAKQLKDSAVEVPVRSASFIMSVDKYMKEGNREFAFLKDGIMEKKYEEVGTGDDAQKIESDQSRTIDFMSAVKEYVSKTYDEDSVLGSLLKRCRFELPPRSGTDTVKAMIQVREQSLRRYFAGVEEIINRRFLGTADSIFPDEITGPTVDLKNPYTIRNLLEIKEESDRFAVHPLAARYLLYTLQRDMTADFEKYNRTADDLRKGIMSYFNDKDWNPKTKKKDQAHEPVPSGLIPLGLSKYKKLYKEESDAQRDLIVEYGRNKFFANVYSVVLERIAALSNWYEKVFTALHLVVQDMNSNCERIQKTYSGSSNTNTYLLASPENMEKVYNTLMLNDNGKGQGEIYTKLLAEIYTSAMTDINQQDNLLVSISEKQKEKRLAQSVVGIFRDKVLPFYQKQLMDQCQDQLNMNIYGALKKQAELDAEVNALKEERTAADDDIDKARREILTRTYRMAAPYLQTTDFNTGSADNSESDDEGSARFIATFWGINDEVGKEISRENSKGLSSFLTPYKAAQPDVIDSIMYSEYELWCYRALYAVRLEEIPKFRESETEKLKGKFYKNYSNRIRKMLTGRYGRTDEGLTPHLDFHWHSKQYIPMINRQMNALVTKKSARAMWLGLFYNCIRKFENETTREIEIRTDFSGILPNEREINGRILFCDGQNLKSKDNCYEIFKAFQQDDISTQLVLNNLDKIAAEDCIHQENNYDFQTMRLANAIIGLSPEEINDIKKQIDEEEKNEGGPRVSVIQYYTDQLFNTNALTILHNILTNDFAAEDEKRIIVSSLWEIISQLRKPSKGKQMPAPIFKSFLMDIFTYSPYVDLSERLRGNAKGYILDAHFADICREYDAAQKK